MNTHANIYVPILTFFTQILAYHSSCFFYLQMLKGEEKIYHADINQKKPGGVIFILPIYRFILRINRIARKYWALVSKSVTHRHM